MDRRQRKTREAIFCAFTDLLSKKDLNRITVGEIIESADVGRATFYAHFETKDFLLKEFCHELFCHIFDSEQSGVTDHRHIFDCNGTEQVFLHLFQHLKKNDNNVISLLSSRNNEVFLSYFKKGVDTLVESHLTLFEHRKSPQLPDAFWEDHISSTFISTLKWWVNNGMEESPEKINEYFFLAV